VFEPPSGKKLPSLTRRKADLWGYEESSLRRIDGWTTNRHGPTKEVKPVLEQLRVAARPRCWVEIADMIVQGATFWMGHYPIDGSAALSKEIAAAFGYDFAAGPH